MSDPDDKARLDALGKRIGAMKAAGRPAAAPKLEDHHSQAQAGWRMVTDLVTGLLLGFAIGFGLDKLFGTLPIFLIVFTLLGFAAGIRVMLRTAREVEKSEGK
jgi:ATP synthase protein I